MRVLYVERGYLVHNPLQYVYHRVQRWLSYRDQDGFFEQSLDIATAVSRTSLSRAKESLNKSQYDWLIVNWKQPGFTNEAERAESVCELLKVAKAKGVRTAVFINAAQAQYLPPEKVLDVAEVIFKREPWRDRTRYPISEHNQQKIVPTMIHCPLVPSPRNHFLARWIAKLQRTVVSCDSVELKYDVGFSGADAAEHSLRRDVWQRVVDENFSRIGGLQPNPQTNNPLPQQLLGDRLTGRAYQKALCAAKVNLALRGIGEYTFRHQELLAIGGFMLSDDSILASELPMPLEEGVHYVAFKDLEDMVSKIRYYAAHDDERCAIAKAGQQLFMRYYNSEVHAKTIRRSLE